LKERDLHSYSMNTTLGKSVSIILEPKLKMMFDYLVSTQL